MQTAKAAARNEATETLGRATNAPNNRTRASAAASGSFIIFIYFQISKTRNYVCLPFLSFGYVCVDLTAKEKKWGSF